ncbi:hypothetical protein AXG93_1923s1260 [Marchantia polymorpha subsp. ruderalis]|uniref:Superoxide dismutase n=1 Tax=Marchantia polymorpha subsp. ruderalis TaxID=1480154 RepID=A0A176VCJ4_MARPO|nr:hypothetical protein AXG93_1923s1260 [Marchantia polymorpha subsp. ruderalis]
MAAMQASMAIKRGTSTVACTARNLLGLQRGFSTSYKEHGYTLPDLPYGYGELEPAISGDIMQLHHSKHHQAYITGFNQALEKLDAAHSSRDPQTIVQLQAALKFNGGGHVNHSIFWKNLAPIKEGGGVPPEGSLASAIEAEFGSLEILKAKMVAGGVGVQGSGWVDPLVTKGLIPLLGIDVWEHAYYLQEPVLSNGFFLTDIPGTVCVQYKNVRPDYLKNIWKVVNWKDVSSRYEENV